jgi:hypothetical protein
VATPAARLVSLLWSQAVQSQVALLEATQPAPQRNALRSTTPTWARLFRPAAVPSTCLRALQALLLVPHLVTSLALHLVAPLVLRLASLAAVLLVYRVFVRLASPL